MTDTEFRKLTIKDQKAYESFIAEFVEAGEKIIPANANPDGRDFISWLRRTEAISGGKELPDGWVPSTIFFWCTRRTGKF